MLARMIIARRMVPMRNSSAILQRARMQSTGSYQPPSPPSPAQPQGSPHGNFYKTFGRPIMKNLLVAVLTYQILYFSWMKLESMEVKQEKEGEMKALEGELKGLTQGKAST